MNAKDMRRIARTALRADSNETQGMIDALRKIAGVHEASCGANVDRDGATLVCALPHDHAGDDHNTAEDGSGDSFPAGAVGG